MIQDSLGQKGCVGPGNKGMYNNPGHRCNIPGCPRTAWDRRDVLDQGSKGYTTTQDIDAISPDDPRHMGLDGTSRDVPGQLGTEGMCWTRDRRDLMT